MKKVLDFLGNLFVALAFLFMSLMLLFVIMYLICGALLLVTQNMEVLIAKYNTLKVSTKNQIFKVLPLIKNHLT